jgi:hypothetical protein
MKETEVVEKRRVQVSRIDLIKRETTSAREAFSKLPEAEKRAIEEESRQYRLKEREEKKREREEWEALREAEEEAAAAAEELAEKHRAEEANRRAEAGRKRKEERSQGIESKRTSTGTNNGTKGKAKAPQPSATEAADGGEDIWYLDCEFCGMTGRNVVSVFFFSLPNLLYSLNN